MLVLIYNLARCAELYVLHYNGTMVSVHHSSFYSIIEETHDLSHERVQIGHNKFRSLLL